jgi:hypothetical protein
LEVAARTGQEIVSHWRKQYANVSLGKPVVDLKVDEKTGQLVFSKATEYSAEQQPELLAQIISLIEESTGQFQEAKSKRQQFIDGFKNKHTTIKSEINGINDSFFKGWEAKDHPTKAVREQWDKKFPASLKSNPAYNLILNGRVLVEIQGAKIKELEAELNKLKGIKETVAAQPPLKADVTPATKSAGNRPKPSDFAALFARQAA